MVRGRKKKVTGFEHANRELRKNWRHFYSGKKASQIEEVKNVILIQKKIIIIIIIRENMGSTVVVDGERRVG